MKTPEQLSAELYDASVPDWDGEVFKSVAQAKRHARSGEISQKFKIKTGRSVCIRLVTIHGDQYQTTF